MTQVTTFHLMSHLAVAKPLLSLVVDAIQNCSLRRINHSNALLCISILYICATFVTTAPLPDQNNDNFSGCFQCMSLMNKKLKQDLDKCTGIEQDCGNCIEGYVQEKNGACVPKDFVETKSGTHIVQNKATVTIKCNFNEEVDCAWSRRGFPLQINSRYSYENLQNGTQTRDCSIKIERFNSNIDFGKWVCSSLADSSHLSIISTTVNLLSERIITVEETDAQAFIPLRESVIIKCKFHSTVDCAWSRQNYHLDISSRYSYVDSRNGQQTEDCSIRIDQFQGIDSGIWKCQSMGDSSSVAMESTNVILKTVENPSMVILPTNASVLHGDKLTIACTFSVEVECQWKLNGAEAPHSRVHFKGNVYQRSKDCSIEIQVPSSHDHHVEEWTCSYRDAPTTFTNSNPVWITIMQKPSSPEIFIENSKRDKRSNDNNIRIICTSYNGWPATKLRWEVEGKIIEPSSSSTVGEKSFNTTITLETSKELQLKNGKHTLKCIASHPAFKNEKIKEKIIYINNKETTTTESSKPTTLNYTNTISDETTNFNGIILIATLVVGFVIVALIAGIVVFIIWKKKVTAKEKKLEDTDEQLIAPIPPKKNSTCNT